jgi:hypothetical protein
MKVHPCLSTVFILLPIACRGNRGDTSHRAVAFETVEYPFAERRIDKAESGGSDLYAEDFHTSEEYMHKTLDGGVAEEEGGSEETGSLIEEETAHHLKPKKVPKQKKHHKRKKITKGPKAEKAPKKGKHKGKKEPKTISPMPTITPRPTSSPTLSPYPSVTPSPSQSPTLTPKPSVSPSPSSPPNVSPDPIATPIPAVSDKIAETVKRPIDEDAESEEANEPQERMNKFAILYELKANMNQPENDDYDEAAYDTSQYLDNFVKTYYDDIDEVIFLGTGMTIWNEPSPLVVDFDAVSYFNRSAVPTTTELDGLIWNAFSSESTRYIEYLKDNLNSTNPLSETNSIKFAPYWTALATQKAEAVQEAPVESSNTAIIAPLVAIGATLVVIAALLVFVRHGRRTAAVEEDDDDYRRKSGNLHVLNGRAEEDTLILDDQSVGGNSHKSYVLSTLEGEDGELVDQSPADVMKALNLTSALSDVDLDDDTDGEEGRSAEI